jgi:hypothetical protein
VDVRLQLSRAGIRLAYMLNTSLGSEPDDWNACLRAGRQSQRGERRLIVNIV